MLVSIQPMHHSSLFMTLVLKECVLLGYSDEEQLTTSTIPAIPRQCNECTDPTNVGLALMTYETNIFCWCSILCWWLCVVVRFPSLWSSCKGQDYCRIFWSGSWWSPNCQFCRASEFTRERHQSVQTAGTLNVQKQRIEWTEQKQNKSSKIFFL